MEIKEKPEQLVKSVDRSLQILEIITKSGKPLGVTEISRKTGIHKSTVYRLLSTLGYRGYISQADQDDKYTVGLKLFEIGSIAINDLDLRQSVAPYLEKLMELTGETIHLGVLDNGEVVYIDKFESQKTIRMYSKIGKRVYAHSTSLGKVLLAFSPEEILERIIQNQGLPQKTKNTITDPDKLKNHLTRISQQGYAVDDEENEIGIRCIAGPVFDFQGKILAAFSISGPAIRITQEKIEEFKELVCSYSQKISGALGYNGEMRCFDGRI